MGMLIDGDWYEDEKAASLREVGASGNFVRTESQFRHWITNDGSAGPTGEGGYMAEPDRYHLYVAHTCPWAHRALIFLNLKKLNKIISVSYAIPGRHQGGWNFREDPEFPDCTPDFVNGFEYLHQAYSSSQNQYTGKVTVPTIWDKKTKQVVNNESSEIIRMLNDSFNSYTDSEKDYYPRQLHAEINSINDIVYNNINNGVYRCGFATSQSAYDKSVKLLFDSLDMIEEKLKKQPYLAGDVITESDWRLFPTLIRFDACYHGAFKCNLRMLRDYPNLTNYTRQLYQIPGISETFNFSYAKKNYYGIERINPNGIVPLGPYNIEEFYNKPHDR
tara:strand:- start:16 stop:1011 length:996 start_codon:yes stop_codon:yes gene_type:complete